VTCVCGGTIVTTNTPRDGERAVCQRCHACVSIEALLHIIDEQKGQLDAAREAVGLSPVSAEPLSAFLTRVLALDTPYPLREVLAQLADAAEHLLNAHSCDAHGYEGVALARDAARKMLTIRGIREASTNQKPCGAEHEREAIR